jgi:serine/threonine protein kinase
MAIDCIDTLLDLLRRINLFTPEQVEEVVRDLVPLYPDPRSLGEYLVEIDWLTAFQLQQVLGGQWDRLTIGPYQLLDRLGEGGVSEVFKAWDTARGRFVALKVLHQHLAGKTDIVRQFRRELEAVTRLSHPNIIKTFDAHQVGSVHYFAMEFVEGMDLDRFVAQVGPLPVGLACDYARQVALGLQHAHQVGLVHRDIKPANLFLLHPPLPVPEGFPPRRGPDPVVKIIDWGLARCLREPGERDGIGGPRQPDSDLDVEKGVLIGTADYLAPEQAREPTLVDIRADIYSLGCSLFFLLTGQPPFPAASLMQKIILHQEAEPPSLKHFRDDIPDELDALVHRMLAKQPEDRYQIPLLVVAPLRRLCQSANPSAGLRPGSSCGALPRPGSQAALKPPSTQNMPFPGSGLGLPRPSSRATLSRPSSQGQLPRPGMNGNGYHK